MADSPINREFGVEADERPDGTVALSLDTAAWMVNEVGLVHGGIPTFLLDGAMGAACVRTLADGETCSTVQLSVQFVARAEGRLTAVGRVVRRGRTVAFIEGECTGPGGRLVARAHGTWVVRHVHAT